MYMCNVYIYFCLYVEVVGSACDTDLDCFLVKGGYGYCDNGKCRIQGCKTLYT